MHVGKAGAKCKDFKEYVHKCLDKLGLKDRISEVCISFWCPIPVHITGTTLNIISHNLYASRCCFTNISTTVGVGCHTKIIYVIFLLHVVAGSQTMIRERNR